MELLIVWFFFAGLTAAVAAAKGRNPLAWGALGVVFGIFALAYVAFAPRAEAPAPASDSRHARPERPAMSAIERLSEGTFQMRD